MIKPARLTFLLPVVFTLLALPSDALAKKRAVVIGFSEYSWAALPGVKTDIRRIGDLLKADYEITQIDDTSKTRRAFRDKWDAFVDTIQDKDEVIVYYAGHGIDIDGLNYLIPLDAPKPGSRRLSSISDDLILLRKLIDEVQERTPALSLFVIDACRTNPYRMGRGTTGGLVPEVIERYSGYTLVFFSADFNQPALDAMPDKGPESGSPFAQAFVESYEALKNRPIMMFLPIVSSRVQQLVLPQDQLPTFQGMVPLQVCLAPCDASVLGVLFSSVQGERRVVQPTTATGRIPASVDGPPPVQGFASLGNVIFIGKTSQLACKVSDVSDSFPFGCDFLKKATSVARNDGKAAAKDIELALALTDINLRRSIPRVEGTRAFYGCTVDRVKRGETVKLKGVAAYQYANDTFLWAVVDRPILTKCKS